MRISGRPLSLRTPGFTLVELFIVMVIIGILAFISFVAFNGIQRQAQIATLQSDLSGASRTLAVAKITEGEYPVNSAADSLLEKSDGTILNYSAGTNQASYCLTAINGDLSYRITDTDTAPSVGACMGVLADGSSCPAGYIVVPGSSTYGTSTFCAMKYIASQSGGSAVSQPGATPWVSISQTDSITAAREACSGCHLITATEWLTIAQNVLSVPSNWSGGSVGAGYIYSGHSDNSPASTLAADASDANGYSGTGNSAPGWLATLGSGQLLLARQDSLARVATLSASGTPWILPVLSRRTRCLRSVHRLRATGHQVKVSDRYTRTRRKLLSVALDAAVIGIALLVQAYWRSV
jgi:prepilin-type N-terminal cleavage/methylation domain-containing protein